MWAIRCILISVGILLPGEFMLFNLLDGMVSSPEEKKNNEVLN